MFMDAALAQARRGVGRTSPNPAVGAAIVRDGRIVAVGYHRAAGKPHAEVEAIRALPDSRLSAGATIYITLEPCCTHGRTPPCTDAIIQNGFARVVYGATDPNPNHAGRAIGILQSAGVQVTAGVLGESCTALNEAWNHWIQTRRPFVIAKCGMSADGRIASHPESRWITSSASRRDAMRLRAAVDAILIGGNTARVDDPALTVRGVRHFRQPQRIIWSPSGRLPRELQVFSDSHRHLTRVMHYKSLEEVLELLGREAVTSVLIEGGGQTLGAAFDGDLVDRVVFYSAPVFLGGPVAAVGGHGVGSNDDAIRLIDPEFERVGPDVRISGRIRRAGV